jgi:phosphatidylinositol alpha-1,6-mannosyltransferase
MNTNPKILVIAKTVIPRSGAGRYAYEIIVRLKQKVSVTVLSEEQSEEGDVRADIILPRHTRLKNFVGNCIQTRRAARDATAVHAFDVWPYGVYGLVAVLGTRKKLVLSGLGTYAVAPLDNRSSALLVRIAYWRSNAVPCISRYTKKEIDVRVKYAPTSVVHMGTTKLPVPTSEEVEAMRTRLQLPLAAPVIVSVGAIKDRKGQKDTLRGIIACADTLPDVHYVIVGTDDDQYVEDIRELARAHSMLDRVHIVSSIRSDRELAACYSLANIFALNSVNDKNHFEGFGLVFLEAAQFGVPGIGSRDCGIEDAIDDGVSGILTRQQDGVDIGKAIQRIMENEAIFKEGARAWYTRFSWDDTVTEFCKLYER